MTTWADPKDVARRLGLPITTVYLLIRRGEIPAVRLGRRWRIPQDRLAEMLERKLEEQRAGHWAKGAGRIGQPS